MERYKGAILDQEGFPAFYFRTPLCNSRTDAVQLARDILYAWRARHPNVDYYYELEEVKP